MSVSDHIICPENESALSEVITKANAPLWIAGGGSQRAAPAGVARLSSRALSGVRLYEPGALTLVAGAGTPLAEITALLAQQGQHLAFEPGDLRALTGAAPDVVPTLGGAVATNLSGPRRLTAGACRDFLLGVRFVDGAGRIVQNGGRVMKNVTGYDLVKLLAGSHGTLGMITEVSLKVLPCPQATLTLIFEDVDPATGWQLMASALGTPYGVSGAAYLPGTQKEIHKEKHREELKGKVCLRLEGLSAHLGARARKLTAHLQNHGAGEARHDTKGALWQELAGGGSLAAQQGDIWRISVKPSDGGAAVKALAPEAWFADWGGGLVWARVAPGQEVRARLQGIRGHATCLRGSAPDPLPPEPPVLAMLTRKIRAQFDPRGLLNPGPMHPATAIGEGA